MDVTKSVLVVDCDPSVPVLVRSCFPGADWNIVCADSLSEALSSLKERAYDLVLTSPRTNGLADVELLRQMRAVRPRLKMIVLTERSTPAAVIASMRAHAFSYFVGPFDSRAISEMIERAVKEPAWDDGIEVLSASHEWISLRLRCRMLTAERILHFMNEVRADLPVKERQDIGTAFREMLLNAMEHGGKFDPEQTVEVHRIRTGHSIIYLIRDPGAGFHLSALPHAAVSNTVTEPFAHAIYREQQGMRPGGFGILLTKGVVDELVYNEKGNEVMMIKRLA
jgi:anti-sigma regulatory factor (Ser/Thr protein kinase)/CheY-like chemotaxis protein